MIETEQTKPLTEILPKNTASRNAIKPLLEKFVPIAKAFIEQGISSLGSFSFFFILARWLESERFGQFSAIWISVQVLTSIAMAWVYLPVTSKAVSGEQEISFYGVCFQRLLKLFAVVPILIALALFFTAKEMLVLPSMLITIVILSAVILTVDFLRYYLIRRGHKMAAALLVSARWGGGISLVLLLYFMQDLTVGNAVTCMLAGNILALFVTALTIKYLRCNIKLVRNAGLEQEITKFSKPLLFQALSGSASGVIVAFAMRSWISTAALGAYQAIRSICNIISPLMQMISTHYSAYLTRKSSFKRNHFVEYSMIIAGSLLVFLSWLFKDFIISNTIGVSYLKYSMLLPILLFNTFIMLYNSLLSAHIRHSGDTKVFNYYGVVWLLSSIILIPVAKYIGSVEMVVGVITVGTIIQCILLKMKLFFLYN